MINCTNCNTSNREGTKYCKNCGALLTATRNLTCPKCNAQNLSTSLYCNRCGERLGATKPAVRPVAPATKNATTTPPVMPPSWAIPNNTPKTLGDQDVPEWFKRVFGNTPTQRQLIPTHELLRMANALGVDVDYSTLRFWQKRGLVSKPVRGPVSSGRGTRGYYDPSLIDRLSFIREIQKHHALGLEAIRDELNQIDKKLAQSTNTPVAQLYRDRLAELQAQRDIESKRTLIAVLSKAMGIDPSEIASVSIEKTNGTVIRLVAELTAVERQRS